jgi:hypothetical protein
MKAHPAIWGAIGVFVLWFVWRSTYQTAQAVAGATTT